MKTSWFKRCGWFYLPVCWPGWHFAYRSLSPSIGILTRPATLYTACSHFFACGFLLFDWIASRNGEKQKS